MALIRRSDLPANRKFRYDILLLEQAFGPQSVAWDGDGRWFCVEKVPLRSSRFEFSLNPIYVLGFVPRDYGERSGDGAGIEEFYVPRDLRYRRQAGAWCQIPNTHLQLDRRNGQVVGAAHLYACVHLRTFDPRRHDVSTSLTALLLLLTDPEAFA